MFDTERFITEIHARESIWNSDETTYYNMKWKNKAWVEVCKAIDGDRFDNLSTKGKNERIYVLKKKWKHIRDQYKKYFNKPNQPCDSEEVVKAPKSYIYSDLLYFLLPVLRTRKNPEDEQKRIYEDDEMKQFGAASSSAKRQNHDESLLPSKKREKKKSHDEEQSKLVEEKRIEQWPLNIEEDADKLFLLSLLPQIRQLNSDQKNYLYIEFLQTIQKAKYYKVNPQINFEPEFYSVEEHHFTEDNCQNLKSEVNTSASS